MAAPVLAASVLLEGVAVGCSMALSYELTEMLSWEVMVCTRSAIPMLIGQIAKVALPLIIFFGHILASAGATAFPFHVLAGVAMGYAVGWVVGYAFYTFCAVILQTPGTFSRMMHLALANPV